MFKITCYCRRLR